MSNVPFNFSPLHSVTIVGDVVVFKAICYLIQLSKVLGELIDILRVFNVLRPMAAADKDYA